MVTRPARILLGSSFPARVDHLVLASLPSLRRFRTRPAWPRRSCDVDLAPASFFVSALNPLGLPLFIKTSSANQRMMCQNAEAQLGKQATPAIDSCSLKVQQAALRIAPSRRGLLQSEKDVRDRRIREHVLSAFGIGRAGDIDPVG